MTGVYSVSQINTYISNMFSRDYALNRITVEGEVSNCKYHSAGHIYFTLKDEQSAISCVMFASKRTGLTFHMADGMKVQAEGSISVYKAAGVYQLYAANIKESGAGELYERFIKLKEKLEEMGMFDPAYKKPIPKFARKIGIVTAPTGAAVQDIINISKRRNPYVELFLFPALVQGNGAAESIVQGIKKLDSMGLDVLIIGRGGGSLEDLWAFNEEIVARAVFDANTPIISAVGHETDFSLSDFAADLRAPTPSAAAELAVFEYEAFCEQLEMYKNSINRNMSHRLELLKERLLSRKTALKNKNPEIIIKSKKEHLLDIKQRLSKDIDGILQKDRDKLTYLCKRLDSLSPLKRISGGFGYITNENGDAVKSVKSLAPSDTIVTYLNDGKIKSRVEDIIV